MASTSEISVSSIGLNGTDKSVLKVAMGLLEKSGCAVRLLEPGDTSGNVILVDLDGDEGKVFYRDFQPDRGQNLLLLSTENLDGKSHPVLKKPLRVQTLKDVVYDIHADSVRSVSIPGQTRKEEPRGASAGENRQGTEAGSREGAAEQAAPAAPFDAGNNLFFVLLAARQEKKVLQIFYSPYPALYVDTTHDIIATSASRETLRKMARNPAGRMNVTKLSLADFDILARGQLLMPLVNFLWSVALFGSQGQLIEGHSPEAPVRLKAWPNLSRMDYEPEHMTLTSILARQPMSVKQLQEKTGIAFERIVGFYNAAWVAGLLEFNPVDIAAGNSNPAIEPKKGGLLAKLARRLNLDAKYTSAV